MRFIKLGIISVIFFALFILIISLLMPSTILVSRSISIHASEDSVYTFVSDISKWKLWCANMENATVSYNEKTTGKGATATFGKTTVTMDSAYGKTIAATWLTGSTDLQSSFSILPGDNTTVTTLQWQFVSHIKWYPWEKFAAIFSDKAIGGFMENSLDKLKTTVERR